MFNRFRRAPNNQQLLGMVQVTDGWSAALIERAGSRCHLRWATHFPHAPGSTLPSPLARRDARGVKCTSLLTSPDYSLVLVDAPEVPPAELRAAVRWRGAHGCGLHAR